MTAEEFDKAVRAACKHCAAGHPAHLRPDTQEYVHNFVSGKQYSHTYCLATELWRQRDTIVSDRN